MKETLVWKGGEHSFWLRIGELRALQQACDAGPLWIWGRLVGNQWLVDDVRETIRLGLIGGGMGEKEAKSLVDRVIDEHALYPHILIAAHILKNAIFGDSEDDVGEAVARKMHQGESNSRAENFDSPNSTEAANRSE